MKTIDVLLSTGVKDDLILEVLVYIDIHRHNLQSLPDPKAPASPLYRASCLLRTTGLTLQQSCNIIKALAKEEFDIDIMPYLK